MSAPNSDLTVAVGSANISAVTPKIAPEIRLIKINAIKAANAPPARSFAQDPPIATANKTCKLPIIAQPISSMILAIVAITAISPPDIATNLPKEIIIPAAGITAITTIKAFPNFCQKSNDINPDFFTTIPPNNSYIIIA